MSNAPVCRRLGSRPLYIGDRRAANPETYAEEPADFATVVTLSRRREPLTTHHHPLDDGANNRPAEFDAAVDTTRALVRADGGLLVHCAAGISRSATVLSTAIAAEEARAFAEGLTVVQRHRERACPHPALREQARRYLDDSPREPVATDPGRRRDRDIEQRIGDDPAGDEKSTVERRGRAEAILDRFFGR
ncbi:protein-tyrosine phosphatase family protein [Halorientalis marina]|jgi:atypical dual specificity phosphatase|uniref:protein-tyrosine phosphatase family protein n=1 Tax=Halorientalis marina TaxID=2931976 RepID=UPI001FF57B30|nr:phosphatase [Halorientalis marina]